MGLTKNQRAIALVAGLALVLSACAGNADPDPSPSEGGGTETSVEPSATVAPVDKRVVEGFVMADARLSPPAGAKWLSGEEEQLWSDDKQLGLMVFDDHHPDSENYPTVELRYSPRHFSREAAAAEVSMIFPEGEFGEPVTIEGQTFERFVGSGELLVGSDYVETPGEVFFARRNEGTYFLYVLGLPGESEISDELRQTAFDALKFDTSTVDEYFPPGQDEGAVTLELESLATYEVGVDIEPGRYEVYAEAPSDVPMVDILFLETMAVSTMPIGRSRSWLRSHTMGLRGQDSLNYTRETSFITISPQTRRKRPISAASHSNHCPNQPCIAPCCQAAATGCQASISSPELIR